MERQATYTIRSNEVTTSAGQVQPTGTIEEAGRKIIQLDADARKYALGARRGIEESLALANECGQWLLYAKSKLRHGDWMPWLMELGVKQSTANKYMAL